MNWFIIFKVIGIIPLTIFFILFPSLSKKQYHRLTQHLTIPLVRKIWGINETPLIRFYNKFTQPRMNVKKMFQVKTPSLSDPNASVICYLYSYLPIEEGWKNGVIVHIHGGGFFSLATIHYDNYISDIAKKTKLPIISIDYSLAPEYPYPTALLQCTDVCLWLKGKNPSDSVQPSDFGISTDTTYVITGDSAGGNLTAAVNIKLMDLDCIPLPNLLLLIYPTLNNDPDYSNDSLNRYFNDPLLDQAFRYFSDKLYVQGNDYDPKTDPCISPLVAHEKYFRSFPPTVFLVGNLDPLLDESNQMYEKLKKYSKKETKLKIMEGLAHAFMNMEDLISKEYNEGILFCVENILLFINDNQ